MHGEESVLGADGGTVWICASQLYSVFCNAVHVCGVTYPLVSCRQFEDHLIAAVCADA